MVVNLVEKHGQTIKFTFDNDKLVCLQHINFFLIFSGVMPKSFFPETFSCENSENMNCVLKSKVNIVQISLV